jgi:hypothetical protein
MLLVHWFGSAAWLWMTYHFLWRQDPLILFLAFFFVGICWLLGAVVQTVQWARFGDVKLDVADPVFPGGKLSAVLRTRFGKVREVTATLHCKRVEWKESFMSEDGHGHLPEQKSIWSRTGRFPVSGGRCRIEFAVPPDVAPSRPHEYNFADRRVKMQWQTPGFRWQVDVRVDTGIGLQRTFFIEVAPAPPGKMVA